MRNKGITFIALVVTIIVLLIIAGISIQMLTGDNGLLIKVATAKQTNEESTELELIKLAVTAAQTAGEGKLTEENLNNALRVNFDDNTIIAEKRGSGWYYKGYCIDKNGNVEIYDNLLPKEYQQVEYIESTGTQWIDTKVTPKETLNGEFDVMCTSNNGYPFGSTNGQNKDYWGINFFSGR